ncbi:putative circulating cathodic antigen [Lucilia cuprina]|uniref:Putative circulating cathodic antigen n=1 Tax=Lucilia cuprina TaxID=7375 RepID=A0A0L0BQ54_LUCCU|nr:Circulating cathodic antigen like protein [Lucilia cuprina]KNC22215.1 putative circulating cathodic antigen [Lucilia cuprina]
MANITVGQIIMDAQKMASRVKELDALSSALLEEAEGNNRFVESLRQFQDDMDSLNRIANNKSNVDMVNRIQQQNANSSEILKENRELKVCIEDYERAMELIMQKYREHTNSKVLESKLNFKEVYNDKLWKIIREQREKINEMAAVMQRAANIDDEHDIHVITRLRLENQTLRELLQISKQFGSYNRPIRFNDHLLEEKGVQTDLSADDSADELSLSGASIENANNNSVIQLNISSTSSTCTAGQPITDNANSVASHSGLVGDNNNVVAVAPLSASPATDKISTTASSLTVTAGGGAAAAVDESNLVTSTTVDYNNLNASAGMEATTNNTTANIAAASATSNLNASPTNINVNSTASAT